MYCTTVFWWWALYCDPSYHGLVFGGGAEAGNAPIQAMMGAARPGYTGYQGGSCSRRGGGGGRNKRTWRER